MVPFATLLDNDRLVYLLRDANSELFQNSGVRFVALLWERALGKVLLWSRLLFLWTVRCSF